MAKPDLTRDYYADLELKSNATEAEIKKQFRQLALKYHPDRNPGRETEVNAKFQTIQAASEILLDPEQKSKYDSGRARAGRSGSSAFSTNRPASGYTPGNPWANAGSNFPPPPTRNTRPKPPPPSAGAARYSRFGSGSGFNPPPPKPASQYDEEEERRRTYAAWQNMRGQRPQQSANQQYRPTPPPPKPGPPPVPKRNGYAPNSAPGDEPPAPSAYYTQRHRPPTAKKEPEMEQAPQPEQKTPNPDPLRMFREKVATPVEPRISTPYAGRGGEKTNPFEGESIRQDRKSNSRSNSGSYNSFGGDAHRDRRRSVSPSRGQFRTSNLGSDFNANSRVGSDPNIHASPKRTFSKATRSSTSGKEYREHIQIDDTSSDESSPEPAERKFAQPKSRKTQNAATPSRSNTFAGTPQSNAAPKTDPKMYDDSKPSTARLQYLRTVRSHTKPPSNPLPMPWMNSSGSETLAPSGVRRAKSSPSPYYGDLGLKSDPSGSRACSTSSMNAFEALQYDTLTKLVEKRGASINGMRRASKDAVRICTPSMPMPRYTSGSYPASAAEKYVLESGAVPRAESGAAIVLNTSQIIIWRIPQQEAMRMRIDYIWKNLEDCAAFLKEYLERPRTNNTSFSFSFQVDGQTFTAHSTPKQFSSSSAENVSTTFTPEDWHGKFESGADYFTSVPQPNLSRAKSAGTSARSGSPPKRRPTVDTNVDNANIDPEILKQSKSAGAKVSPPLAESTFNAGDWAEHFAPPQPTPARSSRPTTSTRRTKVGSSSSKGPKPRAAAVESDDDDVIFMASRPVSAHSKSKFPTDGAFVGSPNAMDIDPQPTANARKVKVEPSRPEWRSGEPNGTGPEPSAASPEKKLKNRDVSDGELKANFDDFKNTAPFNTLATGLKDFTDLKSSVPFPSKASSAIPIAKGFGSQLNLPKPPRGPDPPAILPDASRPTQAAFDQYVARFGAYMNDWEKFNSQMVTHFNSRKAQVDLFPREWWNQIGDVVLDKYMGGLKEDEEIRTYWDVACGKHKQTVEEFAWAKKVFRDGLQSAGQKTVPLFGEVP